MESENIIIKEEMDNIESLVEELPFIKEESDQPDYVNVLAYSDNDIKPDEKAFKCPQCPVKYTNLQYLTIHSLIHNGDMSCPLCPKIAFTYRKKFIQHINHHLKLNRVGREKPSHICSYCGKNFRTKKALTIHIRVHTNERPYKCEICGEGFKQAGALNVHQVTHTKEKKFICDICNGAYTTPSSLKRHKRKIHDRGRTINCTRCSAKFQNKADFDSHLQSAHPKVPFRKVCPLCFEECFGRRAYNKHTRLHGRTSTGRLSYLCKLCGEAKSTLKAFVEHRKLHLFFTDEELKSMIASKTLKCKFCSQVFKLNASFCKHMERHMEKTITCDLTDNFFTDKKKGRQKLTKPSYKYKNQIKRYRVVKKARKYQFKVKHRVNSLKKCKCGICGKRLLTRLAMAAHKKILHGIKVKFKCSKCGLTFKNYQTVVQHKLTHTTNTKTVSKTVKHFRCRACRKTFQSMKNYMVHASNCVRFSKQRTGKNSVGELDPRLRSDPGYQCLLCDKNYKTTVLIHSHIKTCHPEEQVFWCNICRQGFKILSDFELHYSSHLIEVGKVEIEEGFIEKTRVKSEIEVMEDRKHFVPSDSTECS